MLEKIRISLGSAAVLGLTHIKVDVYPTTCYVMTYTTQNCIGKCSFCPQGTWDSESSAKKLSRVSWPSYSFSDFLDRLLDIQKNKEGVRFSRLCLQVINYPSFFDDIYEFFKIIHSHLPDLKISTALPPLSLEKLKALKEVGVERIAFALDACTKEIFDKVKGKDCGGPYSWEDHWKHLEDALTVFGKGFVTTHFIIGLGESEEDAISAIYTAVKKRILPGLFMFMPVRGTPLEHHSRPPLISFRKVQLARSLLMKNPENWNRFKFKNGVLTKIEGFSEKDLLKEIERQFAFKTAGCPSCNRPYYTSRPGEEPDGFPRDLLPSEKRKVFLELKEIIDPFTDDIKTE